ncbi:hypothetical protein JYU34_004143 [Plutella xylostella]|uniref:Uncharacterized protein n=1 Tax=Plutella xylostella TaxID=51655 RepID=A0ABQ7QXA6_PLUXY|nr:hypothetical protein JYU34_004143 [Plutella xylostella]
MLLWESSINMAYFEPELKLFIVSEITLNDKRWLAILVRLAELDGNQMVPMQCSVPCMRAAVWWARRQPPDAGALLTCSLRCMRVAVCAVSALLSALFARCCLRCMRASVCAVCALRSGGRTGNRLTRVHCWCAVCAVCALQLAIDG